METLKVQVETLIDKSKYDEAVNLVAEKFDIGFEAIFLKNSKHFIDDKDFRDIYLITLTRDKRKYTFEFGQSVDKSGFYAQYGRKKYPIPRIKINESDDTLRYYVKTNLQYDFGMAKDDKIIRPIAPTLYDVLSCLQKYDVGSFEDFCNDFGYTNEREHGKIYNAVCKEYDKMCSLFNDEELEVLQIIA